MRTRLVIALLVAAGTSAAQEGNGPPPAFQRAYAAAEAKDYAKALEILDAEVRRGEHLRNALFSAGTIAKRAGRYEAARDYLVRLRELEPESGVVRMALVQAYSGTGETAARERERGELFRLRAERRDPALAGMEHYLREEIPRGALRIACLEHFELKGDRAVRYAFVVFRGESEEAEYRISLGSYTATNALWQQMQTPKEKRQGRVFHLDGYPAGGGHVNYGMKFPEPSYDETKQAVLRILDEREAARGGPR